ncbi:MAG: hypothetical protein PHE67_04275 [Campylobacterales bacterium]|nr:hypothetical protein [Campylobacterales bacterium]
MTEPEIIIEKMMAYANITSQEQLAKILEVFPASISKYKVSGVPRKRINLFLQKYPNIKRSQIQGEELRDIENISEDVLLLASIVEEYKRYSNALSTTKKLEAEKKVMIQKLANKKFKKNELFGPFKNSYFTADLKEEKIEVLPLGFCVKKECPPNKCCLTCENFITTSDYLPIFRSISDHMKKIKHLTKNRKLFQTNLDSLLEEIGEKNL